MPRDLHDELVAVSPRTREVQFDEKWAFVAKKEAHCDPADPADDRKGGMPARWCLADLRQRHVPHPRPPRQPLVLGRHHPPVGGQQIRRAAELPPVSLQTVGQVRLVLAAAPVQDRVPADDPAALSGIFCTWHARDAALRDPAAGRRGMRDEAAGPAARGSAPVSAQAPTSSSVRRIDSAHAATRPQ